MNENIEYDDIFTEDMQEKITRRRIERLVKERDEARAAYLESQEQVYALKREVCRLKSCLSNR